MSQHAELIERLREWAAEKVAIGAVPPTIDNHARKLKIGEGLYRMLPALAALVEERDRLREALKPFCGIGDTSAFIRDIDHGKIADTVSLDGFYSPRNVLPFPTLGDLRRARAALAQEPSND